MIDVNMENNNWALTLSTWAKHYNVDLPEALEEIESCNELVVSRNIAGRYGEGLIPNAICNSSKLTKLDINGSGLNELPKDIGNIESLRELHAVGISRYPDSIINLDKLKSFSFSERCKFTYDQMNWIKEIYRNGCEFNIVEENKIYIQSYKLGDGKKLPKKIDELFVEQDSIQDVVLSRKIDVVWHFTQLSNLDSILEKGLLPRNKLLDHNFVSVFNDSQRLDGYLDAICCSISYPNYRMLSKLMAENPDSKWILLAIHPSMLWERECAFNKTNAASTSMTSISIEKRKGHEALEGLFSDIEGITNRKSRKLADNLTTDPQAEVLVFGHITNNQIYGVVFQDEATEKEYMEKYLDTRFISNKSMFSPRKDYETWQ